MNTRDRLIEVLTAQFEMPVGDPDDPGRWRISRSAARAKAVETVAAMERGGLAAVALPEPETAADGSAVWNIRGTGLSADTVAVRTDGRLSINLSLPVEAVHAVPLAHALLAAERLADR